ncbi:MAG: hypothetical protein M3380_04670, partial [Chloroflexota bacterium]|nr:hypothetical protein [Chloroflexota bacterium]
SPCAARDGTHQRPLRVGAEGDATCNPSPLQDRGARSRRGVAHVRGSEGDEPLPRTGTELPRGTTPGAGGPPPPVQITAGWPWAPRYVRRPRR